MKRRQSISPGALSRMFQAAADSWKQQDYPRAIEILERATRLDPANSSLLLDLGRAHGMRYDFASALLCFEKAVRVAPRKLDALAAAGERAREYGDYHSARRFLEQAANESGAPAGVFVALAEIHEREHRHERAALLIDRALTSNPASAPARLFRARLDRLAGRLDEAEKRLRELLSRTGVDAWTRAQAWYELGGTLDRAGGYDQAWAALLEAKALLRPAAAAAAAALQAIQSRTREMEQSITAGVWQRWFDFGAQLQPPRRFAVLCGHPRSGTTLLEQMLDSHPDMVSAEETHVLHDEAYLPLSRGFPQDASMLTVLEPASVAQLREARENYFRCTELFLGKTIGGRLLIDKNPALNVLAPAVVRIFPETKFLFARRDPRDVCLSCFMQPLAINPVSSAYLTMADTVMQYASVMSFWQVMLPRMRNAHFEVRYEELVNDPEAVSRRVLDFLGAPWDDRVLRFDEHARQKLVRSPTYADVTRPVFKTAVGRWRNYEKHLAPHLEVLRPHLRAFGYE